MKTEVNAAKCPTCGDLIFSRANHDFHECSCGEIAIDGGFNYVRMAFKTVRPEIVKIYVDATRDELYDDWNHRKNKWGTIKAPQKNFDRTNKVKEVKNPLLSNSKKTKGKKHMAKKNTVKATTATTTTTTTKTASKSTKATPKAPAKVPAKAPVKAPSKTPVKSSAPATKVTNTVGNPTPTVVTPVRKRK
jgi:hypothetical protein